MEPTKIDNNTNSISSTDEHTNSINNDTKSTNEHTSSFSDKIRNNIPLISAGILIISVIRLVLYYNTFGINIMSYIDLSESITISIPIFIRGVIVISIIVTFSVYLSSYSDNEDVHLVYLKLKTTANLRFKIYKGLISTRRIIFTSIISLFLVVVLIFSIKYNLLVECTSSFCLCCFIFLFVDILISEFNYLNEYHLNNFLGKYTGIVYVFFVIFFLMFYSLTKLNAQIVTLPNLYDKVRFVKEKNIIKTSETYRYIGKTKEYIFFYNIETGYSNAFKIEDAKTLSIKEADNFLYAAFKKVKNDISCMCNYNNRITDINEKRSTDTSKPLVPKNQDTTTVKR